MSEVIENESETERTMEGKKEVRKKKSGRKRETV